MQVCVEECFQKVSLTRGACVHRCRFDLLLSARLAWRTAARRKVLGVETAAGRDADRQRFRLLGPGAIIVDTLGLRIHRPLTRHGASSGTVSADTAALKLCGSCTKLHLEEYEPTSDRPGV